MRPTRGGAVLAALAVALAAASQGDDAHRGYDEQEALTFSYLATAAYCGQPRTSRASLEAWKCGPACDHVKGVHSVRQVIHGSSYFAEASAYVARWRDLCVVAIRGTADKTEWFEDIRSAWHVDPNTHGMDCSYNNKSCFVGSGWLAAYGSIREHVQGNLTDIGCHPGSKLIVTGHSLGGAAAQLAMFDLSALGYKVQRSFVFGSPRTGDASWVSAFTARFNATDLFRVTFRRDPVPHLPPMALGFTDAPMEVFYHDNVSMGYEECDGSNTFQKCSAQYTSISQLIKKCLASIPHCDHLQYMTSMKQIPMSGASCVDGLAGARVLV